MADPYLTGAVSAIPSILRNPLEASFVGVIDIRNLKRGLQLIPQKTRCIRRKDVHEILLTDESGATSMSEVDRSFGIGFVEFSNGGLLVEGDSLTVAGRLLGHIAGFDETHLPNHLNIVIKADKATTGIEFGIKPGDLVQFVVSA